MRFAGGDTPASTTPIIIPDFAGMTKVGGSAIPHPMLAQLQALRTRPFLVALLIGIAAQLLFTIHIDRPGQIMFDETHYVPAAQALLDLGAPRNQEHPLLGKELIALGMKLFGDNPFGWRVIPSLFGTATVLGVFAFLWLLLGRMRPAIIGVILVVLNQLVFIQARIAMLDVFLGAFVVWALVAMLWAMRGTPKQVLGRWILASTLLGLAVAVKWAAIPYEALAALAFVVLRVRDRRMAGAASRGVAFNAAWTAKEQRLWPGLGTLPALLILGAVSIPVYFLTFLPAFFYARDPLTLATLIPYQLEMYSLQTQVLHGHPYQSDWWSWPLLLRPIWYFYAYDMGAQRGVLMIGNPAIMWGGLLAVGACLFAWFRTRAIRPLAMALLWIASLAMYAIIPKSLGFYYYYYLSSIFLAPVIAVAFDHFDRGRGRGYEDWFAALSLLVFVYFYPIIAAAPLGGVDSFNHWMWLGDRWR